MALALSILHYQVDSIFHCAVYTVPNTKPMDLSFFSQELFKIISSDIMRMRGTDRMLKMICRVTLNDRVMSTVIALRVGVNDLEEHFRQ